MTTSQKLWAGFGTLALVLVLILSGLVAWLFVLGRHVDRIAFEVEPSNDAAQEIEININEIGMAVSNYLHDPEPSYRRLIADNTSEFHEAIRQYRELTATPREQALADWIEANFGEYHALGLQLMDQKDLGFVRGDDLSRFIGMRIAADDLLDEQIQPAAMEWFIRETDHTRDLIHVVLWCALGAFVIGVGIVGTTSLVLGRSIQEDLRIRRGAEHAARDSEARLKLITDAEPALISYINRDYRYQFTNKTYERWFGHAPQMTKNRPVAEVLGEKAWEAVRPYMQRALAGETVIFEQELPYSGSGPMWVRVIYTPDRDEQTGEVRGFAVLVTDIGDRIKAEAALRESEQKLRLAMDAAELGTWTYTLETNMCEFDEKSQSFYGVSEANYLHDEKGVRELLHPDDIEPMWRAVEKACDPAGDRRYRSQYRTRQPDGSYRWLSAWAHVEFDQSGRNPVRFHGLSRDISARVEAERALRESEERFRLATSAGKVGVYDWDIQNNKVTWSDTLYAIHGLEPGTFGGDFVSFQNLVHPEDRERVGKALDQALNGETPYEVEFRIVGGDGQLRWVFTNAQVVRDSDGKPIRLLGGTVDITQRKRAEEALRQQTSVLQTLNRTANMLAGELELGRLVQKLTDAATELCGAQFGAFFHNDTNENGEVYTLYSISGAPREKFSKFPIPRNTELFGPTFRGEGIVRLDDVTKDARFGKNAPHYGLPKDHLPVRSYLAVPVVSRSGGVLGALFFGHERVGVFTAQAEELLGGLAAQAAIAIDNAQLFQSAQRELEVRRLVEQALRESEERFRTLADNISQFAWTADETGALHWFNKRWYEYTGTTYEEMQGWGWRAVHHPDHVERVTEKFRDHILAGKEWEDTFPLRGKDGKYRWFLSRAVPIRDEQGNVIRWFGTNTDITEQKQFEETLKGADRRKDQFLAMLAHELRNPLAPIRHVAELMEISEYNPEEMKSLQEILSGQVDQMTRLIDDLLDVSRISRGKIQLKLQPMDLRDAIRSAVEAVRPLIEKSKHELKVEIPDKALPVKADPARMSQVISNLLNNAAKYTRDGGRISLKAEQINGDISVRVKDNGIGIPPEKLNHIFEMFSQIESAVRGAQGGLGIGLSLVKSLVEMHGGAVAARSAGPDTGSEFTIMLPFASQTESLPPTRSADPEAKSNGRFRVLVVEDHEVVAEIFSKLLKGMGHEVTRVASAEKGLEVLHSMHPDVIFSDISMPGMNGYEFARRLRGRPELRDICLVAVTGYGQQHDRQSAMEAGFDHHMVKPPKISELNKLFATLGAREAVAQK